MWPSAHGSGGFSRHHSHPHMEAHGSAHGPSAHDGRDPHRRPGVMGSRGQVNPWFSLINPTAVELIPKTVFDICKQANVQQETVEGIAGCINAWKSACNPITLVKMMAEAYCSRKTAPHTKLAIFYIMHHLTKLGAQEFAGPIYRHFLLVITPIAAELPSNIQKSHLRTLEHLRKQNVFTKEQVALVSRLFTIRRAQEIQHIADKLNNPSLHDSRSIFVFTTPTVAGKVSSFMASLKSVCFDARPSEAKIGWAESLLSAAGATHESLASKVSSWDEPSRDVLFKAFSASVKMVSLEVAVLQLLMLDLSVVVSESESRILALVDYFAAGKNTFGDAENEVQSPAIAPFDAIHSLADLPKQEQGFCHIKDNVRVPAPSSSFAINSATSPDLKSNILPAGRQVAAAAAAATVAAAASGTTVATSSRIHRPLTPGQNPRVIHAYVDHSRGGYDQRGQPATLSPRPPDTDDRLAQEIAERESKRARYGRVAPSYGSAPSTGYQSGPPHSSMDRNDLHRHSYPHSSHASDHYDSQTQPHPYTHSQSHPHSHPPPYPIPQHHSQVHIQPHSQPHSQPHNQPHGHSHTQLRAYHQRRGSDVSAGRSLEGYGGYSSGTNHERDSVGHHGGHHGEHQEYRHNSEHGRPPTSYGDDGPYPLSPPGRTGRESARGDAGNFHPHHPQDPHYQQGYNEQEPYYEAPHDNFTFSM